MAARGEMLYRRLEDAVCCGDNVGSNSECEPWVRRSVPVEEAVSRESSGDYSLTGHKQYRQVVQCLVSFTRLRQVGRQGNKAESEVEGAVNAA